MNFAQGMHGISIIDFAAVVGNREQGTGNSGQELTQSDAARSWGGSAVLGRQRLHAGVPPGDETLDS